MLGCLLCLKLVDDDDDGDDDVDDDDDDDDDDCDHGDFEKNDVQIKVLFPWVAIWGVFFQSVTAATKRLIFF